jgi:hypothetical protein
VRAQSIGVLACVIGFTMPSGLPPNISVSLALRDVVAVMLRESETFRSQSRLLGTMPHVRVRISLEMPPGRVPASLAQGDMRRDRFGAITAFVHLRSRDNAIELIAHELEHVIEFAEGTNYRALARLQPASAWEVQGAFETSRAVDAGRRVKLEASLATAHR